MKPVRGTHLFVKQLCEALGIDPGKTFRVVLDCSVNDLVKVYVQQYLDQDRSATVLDVVRQVRADELEVIPCVELSVADDGTVTHVPSKPQS